ncbi:unnamed protein product, partial [Iphiclides podalirius]
MGRFVITFLVVTQRIATVLSQQKVPENITQAVVSGSQTSETTATLKCGFSNPGGLIYRFQNGPLADFGEFPWMVAIIRKSNVSSHQWQQKDYVAAGSIIHPSVVLTTAHWIGELNPGEIKSRAGEWDTSGMEELYVYQERNVMKVVKHPDFFSESLANDLALLFLDEPYDLPPAPHMGSVCVAQTVPVPGSECFGMGWGLGAKNRSNVLMKLKVNVLSRDDCEELMKKTRLGDSFQLHESFVCASSAESCEGDIGASLVCPITGDSARFSLYGLSAYRVSEPGAPCLYVNAPSFYKWIGESMAEEGFNTSTYTYEQS